MPCIKCPNGKWKWGANGRCQFRSKAHCQRAARAIRSRNKRLGQFASSGHNNSRFHDILDGYKGETKERFRQAIQNSVRTIGRRLIEMDEGASRQEVTDAVIFHLYNNWDANFTDQQRKIIDRWVGDAYEHFRTTTAQMGSIASSEIPDATFDAVDRRVIEFFKENDDFYLGKFITDDDVRKDVNRFIEKKLVEEGLPIGRDSPAIKQFKDEFGDLLEGKDWKIDQVLNTTVGKLRNYGAVQYMHQANVTKFRVQGVADRRQCPYCAGMGGKVLSVKKERDKIQREVNSDPRQVPLQSPFLTSVIETPKGAGSPQERENEIKRRVRSTRASDLQGKGVGSPPYHPGCRDTVIAVTG